MKISGNAIIMQNVLNIAKDTYFPNGSNSVGNIHNLECFIGNANKKTIPPSLLPVITLDEYCEQSVRQRLRLYLFTKKSLKASEKKKKKQL